MHAVDTKTLDLSKYVTVVMRHMNAVTRKSLEIDVEKTTKNNKICFPNKYLKSNSLISSGEIVFVPFASAS